MNKIFHPSRLYPIILILLMYGVYQCRQQDQKESTKEVNNALTEITGKAMGTTYKILYYGDTAEQINKTMIDSAFDAFNMQFSTYEPQSTISQLNKKDTLCGVSPAFIKMLSASKDVYTLSEGYFDPTLLPLINAWGFGPEEHQHLPTDTEVDSLLELTGMDNITWNDSCVYKHIPGMTLDLNAIAKGYGVDIISELLLSHGIGNHMVEIGGEVIGKGKKPDGSLWRIGIEKPVKEKRELYAALTLENIAMASSGNYRNYYEKEGRTYAHTIDPHTGKPVSRSILSATIVAPECHIADAYATACMAGGMDIAKKMLEHSDELEGYLIYEEEGKLHTYTTKGLHKLVHEYETK